MTNAPIDGVISPRTTIDHGTASLIVIYTDEYTDNKLFTVLKYAPLDGEHYFDGPFDVECKPHFVIRGGIH